LKGNFRYAAFDSAFFGRGGEIVDPIVNGGGADVTTAFAAGILSAKEGAMIDPDDLPKKKIVHEIGQDLSLLSVAELGERIGFLKEEIARLEAEMTRKRASQNAANAFFKK
jgi:uncharacterized small protein (DUF1192 family)